MERLTKKVIDFIKNQDTKEIYDKVKYKKDISINLSGENHIINPEEIIIEEVPINNYSVVSNKKYTIGINTLLSDIAKIKSPFRFELISFKILINSFSCFSLVINNLC